MALLNFLKAFVVGIMLSMPFGPLGVVVIQRTLQYGRRVGRTTGYGGTVNCIISAVIALFSLSFVSDFLEKYRPTVLVVGGCVVVLLGVWYLFFKKTDGSINATAQKQEIVTRKGSVSDVLAGFLVAVSNPAGCLTVIAVFAVLGVQSSSGAGIASALLGIITATVIMWNLLAFFADRLRSKLNDKSLCTVTRICGAAIVLLGAVTLIKGLM